MVSAPDEIDFQARPNMDATEIPSRHISIKPRESGMWPSGYFVHAGISSKPGNVRSISRNRRALGPRLLSSIVGLVSTETVETSE